MFAIFTAVGRAPSDLTLGIVNQELEKEYKTCEEYISDKMPIGRYEGDDLYPCAYEALGCKFGGQIQQVISNQVIIYTFS